MTTSPQPPENGAPSEEEDDHDLLTYGIAGDRLRAEIKVESAELTAAIHEAGPKSDRAAKSRARIEQLEWALDRQVESRADQFNEKQFFGEDYSSEPQG